MCLASMCLRAHLKLLCTESPKALDSKPTERKILSPSFLYGVMKVKIPDFPIQLHCRPNSSELRMGEESAFNY